MKIFKHYLNKNNEVGTVQMASKSIVYVDGLPSVQSQEVVVFETGEGGIVLHLHPQFAEVLLFSHSLPQPGVRVVRSNEKLTLEIGEKLLGSVVDPLCRYSNLVQGSSRARTSRRITGKFWGIEKRPIAKKPLETGVAMVDTLIPLAKGQRQLIIGDRKTGKTNFLLSTVLNQAKQDTICILSLIGKNRGEIKKIEEFFAGKKAMDNICIIASSSQDPGGLIYLTPYTGITAAEYFRDKGKDVLLILDDMTAYAKFCRETSLLAKRFPGRDSYPVDIFFTQSAILERGGNFRISEGKEASITILPVAETINSDLGGYIQTNLMSMTDGHIYFDNDLFFQGLRPAINPFLSITRVGFQAQTQLRRELGRELLSFLSHFGKLKDFMHFGAELTDEVKKNLDKGKRITAFFDQQKTRLIPSNVSIFILGLLWQGYGKDKPLAELKKELMEIVRTYKKDNVFYIRVNNLVVESKSFDYFLKQIDKQKNVLLKSVKFKQNETNKHKN